MNPVLKAILVATEAVAVKSVPGAGLADAAVHAVVEHRQNIQDAFPDLAEAAIQAIEGIKDVDIADEIGFRAGVATVNAGVAMIRMSLKVKDGIPAPK